MTRPMTTEELFGKINGILKEKGRMPDILDYSHVTGKPVPIWTYEFDLKSSLYYGANEGIYLELWIEYFEDGGEGSAGLGTFKTLREDGEAMHTMASLLADFIIEEYAYVNANLDDFTWEGANIYVFNGKGEKMGWAYTCGSMEAALREKDRLLNYYPKAVVRDNATRKETVFTKYPAESRRASAGRDNVEGGYGNAQVK